MLLCGKKVGKGKTVDMMVFIINVRSSPDNISSRQQYKEKMPKIPKKVPKWLTDFTEYARNKEKRDGKDAIDAFESIIEKRWDRFVSQCEKDAPPPKKRKIDPIKTFANAAKKMADSLPEGGEELKNVQAQLKDVVPEHLQMLLQPTDVTPPRVLEEIERLYEESAQSKNALETLASSAGDGPFKQSALEAVTKICSGLEIIKTNLEAPGDPMEDEKEEETDDVEEEEKEEIQEEEVSPVALQIVTIAE